MNMLHHLSFSVSDLKRSAIFYDATLGSLGYRRVCEAKSFIGYGVEENKDKFAIAAKESQITPPSAGFHLAFSAPSRDAVNVFYALALKNGGRDNGAPGLRPQYGPTYYAAFVFDPDGYRIEAVISE
jgi:catechol 2,3-dioxygenase-like lactoylglutathione lyase family enzyme